MVIAGLVLNGVHHSKGGKSSNHPNGGQRGVEAYPPGSLGASVRVSLQSSLSLDNFVAPLDLVVFIPSSILHRVAHQRDTELSHHHPSSCLAVCSASYNISRLHVIPIRSASESTITLISDVPRRPPSTARFARDQHANNEHLRYPSHSIRAKGLCVDGGLVIFCSPHRWRLMFLLLQRAPIPPRRRTLRLGQKRSTSASTARVRSAEASTAGETADREYLRPKIC